jgi:hypothetical protein
MLCKKCSNKNICKYYAFFADAPMVINIESCEKFISKEIPSNNNNHFATQDRLVFKKPIDYSEFETFKPENNEALFDIEEEEEERITVDLSQTHENKVVSISDLLLGDDK